MKISCEVVKDLLPLYHDNVCSKESKIIVEEHLDFCDNCRVELEIMGNVFSINNPEQNLKEAETVQKLSGRWRKDMMKSLLKGIFFTIIGIVIFLMILYIFIDFKIVPKYH